MMSVENAVHVIGCGRRDQDNRDRNYCHKGNANPHRTPYVHLGYK
jgi:hypothetical protein